LPSPLIAFAVAWFGVLFEYVNPNKRFVIVKFLTVGLNVVGFNVVGLNVTGLEVIIGTCVVGVYVEII
jgi:hypothetical protein